MKQRYIFIDNVKKWINKKIYKLINRLINEYCSNYSIFQNFSGIKRVCLCKKRIDEQQQYIWYRYQLRKSLSIAFCQFFVC